MDFAHLQYRIDGSSGGMADEIESLIRLVTVQMRQRIACGEGKIVGRIERRGKGRAPKSTDNARSLFCYGEDKNGDRTPFRRDGDEARKMEDVWTTFTEKVCEDYAPPWSKIVL